MITRLIFQKLRAVAEKITCVGPDGDLFGAESRQPV